MWKAKLSVCILEEVRAEIRGLACMGPICECLFYQFADDVAYHDMTFLYPLSIV